MIRKQLEQWLAAAFMLPIVEDIAQTKVEQAISYDLTGQPVKVRHESDKSIHFSFNVTIQYRCPNGSEGLTTGIGFLSIMLNDTDNQPPGFGLTGFDGAEIVEYHTKTEMIISKVVNGYMRLEYNQVRELLKCVKFTDGLTCNECEE